MRKIILLFFILQSCSVNCLDELIEEYNLGNYEEVVKLADSCKDKSTVEDVYFIKASAYFELEKYFEAKRELARFMVGDIVNLNIAEKYYACDIYLNKNEEARANFVELIHIDSTKSSLYYRLGQANFNLSLYKEAIEAFSKAISLDSNNVEAITDRGLAFQRLKQYENSIDDFTLALGLLPKNYILFYNRGVSYGFLKEYEYALDDFSKSISLNSSFSQVYIDRGIIFNELGDKKSACDNFFKAKDLRNDNVQEFIDDICKGGSVSE